MRREEQGECRRFGVGGWVEEKEKQTDWKKTSGSVLAICHPTKDNSKETAALFHFSFLLKALHHTSLASQLQPCTFPYCYGPIYTLLRLGTNWKNGRGIAIPLAIDSTSKGYIASEQRGH